MLRRISLANKCLLLFGAAVVLIIMAALGVPWLRMNAVVDEEETETSRQMLLVWEASVRRAAPAASAPGSLPDDAALDLPGGTIAALSLDAIAQRPDPEPFLTRAVQTFEREPSAAELVSARWAGWVRQYQFARAVRADDGTLQGLIYLQRTSPQAGRDVLVNAVYLLSAGCVALGLAVLVFYLITNNLILGPVRALRDTADEVRQGNLDTRSTIETGDEFEDLAEMFNAMLQALQDGQKNLRAINTALDARVGELQAQTLALHESNRLKGEFLANVSHELRTPMNSILGFADILLEIAEKEAAAGDDSTRLSKRKRYLENIVSSGRHLLDLINGLLEMAKVEAGKVEIRAEEVDLPAFAEGMLALMRPVADKRGVELRLDLAAALPAVLTDRQKLQQVVFNLLSNGVKFSGDAAEAAAIENAPPRQALVTLRVEPLLARSAGGETATDKVRISVLDTGPGIAPEHLDIIFEKFTQLDRGYSRKHAGTGLGLAISKELTHLLQGEIQVQSELGRGSMFSVILPVRLDASRLAETKLEASFRSNLQGRSA